MNVIMVGFMGSGKTAVGRRLAQRLGYVFLDTDHFIETQLGKSINEVFAQEGEAYFRRLESALAGRLSALNNYVVSTGGGMVATPGNMELLRAAGTVVFLDADQEEIIRRLERDTKRPMLKGHELRERVERLLGERRHFYEMAHVQVETKGKTVNRVAGEVIRQLGAFEATGA